MNPLFKGFIAAGGVVAIFLALLLQQARKDMRDECRDDRYPLASNPRLVWTYIIGSAAAGLIAIVMFGLAVMS